MSIGVKLEVEGIKELQKKLNEKNVTQPLNDGIKKSTFLLEREVKQATVTDTGRLRSSMTTKFGAGFGQVGTNVEYAPVIEFGADTRDMPARHMEGSAKILGEGMFAFGLRKLAGKMKSLLGDVANTIETRWK